jgi:TPR repeat protein
MEGDGKMRDVHPHTLATAFALLLILCGSAPAATQAASDTRSPAARSNRTALNVAWAQVLDEHVPLSERQQALSQIEQEAQTGDQHDLYLLGSLYYMGRRASGSLVQQDLDKASLYLSNAAMHGSVLGMAKTAEVMFATHQYREAMNWAQIYGHYALLLPKSGRPHDGYAAELVQRILDKLGRAAMPEVMRDVDSFIASHDAEIRSGTDSKFTGENLHPVPKAKPYVTLNARLAPRAGFVDYLLAFKADGSVANVFLLDAVPDPALGSTLRKYAMEMVIAPAGADAGNALRYAWMPVTYDDGRYRAVPLRGPRLREISDTFRESGWLWIHSHRCLPTVALDSHTPRPATCFRPLRSSPAGAYARRCLRR